MVKKNQIVLTNVNVKVIVPTCKRYIIIRKRVYFRLTFNWW